MILFADTETFSSIPLEYGVYKYAEAGRVMLFQYSIDDEQVDVIEWDRACRGFIQGLVEDAARVVLHNSEFDVTMLARMGVTIPRHKVYCTMAQARRHGLPGGLDKLSSIFKLSADKSKMAGGRKLMHLFCKPQKDGRVFDASTHPAEWATFRDEYAPRDVIAMRELYYKMPRWNDESERAIWELDATLNARGFCVDTQFAWWAVQLIEESKEALNKRTAELTADEVARATMRDKLLAFILREHGVDLPDLQSATLERWVKDLTLPDEVRELIAIRMQSARSSVSKYQTLLNCVNADNRLRGVKVYCGAQRTGRWSAQKFQSDNMPRPTLPPEEILHAVESIRDPVRRRGSRFPHPLVDYPLSRYAAEGIRGCVVAPPGGRLLVADLANIEGRDAAWLAGERWKLQAFENYDLGVGPDLYKIAYARACGIGSDGVAGVVGILRQIGKILELMMQYGGGVGAMVTGAETYHVHLEDMVAAAWDTIPVKYQKDAGVAWVQALMDDNTFDLDERVWCTCFALSRLWRRTNPAIRDAWYAIESAAKHTAIDGRTREVCMLEFSKVDSWLRMRLPSGRYLCYPSAKIHGSQLSFMGFSSYTKRWQRIYTWGGTLFENACQAVARDVLVDGLLAAEFNGLNPILHVHDEIICEVDADRDIEAYLKELEECMVSSSPWAAGTPLSVKGFHTDRYYKEL